MNTLGLLSGLTIGIFTIAIDVSNSLRITSGMNALGLLLGKVSAFWGLP
jgi:hypothetical protein